MQVLEKELTHFTPRGIFPPQTLLRNKLIQNILKNALLLNGLKLQLSFNECDEIARSDSRYQLVVAVKIL